MNKYISKIASELELKETQVEAVTGLLEQDATIPFIARYRKEATDSLDEVEITAIRDRIGKLKELDARRESVLKSLEQHGHLTDELEKEVMAAEEISTLEDIYLPYKPKRRTKASIARERGLEPLAEIIFAQTGADPFQEAQKFVDPEKGVDDVEAALTGARNIMAEIVSENQDARSLLRSLFASKGILQSSVASGKESEGKKYRDYFKWEESVSAVPSHRLLAMRRGEKEDILNLTIAPKPEDALNILEELFIKGSGDDSEQVRFAINDCYKRLLSRSMETEIRLASKEKADTEAIKIFADNLKELLLAPPLAAKRVMGIDPGFRTGCKTVCLDNQGKLLCHDTIFPNMNQKKDSEAADQVKNLCKRFSIGAIAVGNGTAGRETEAFLKKIGLPENIRIIMVNESGASIYSASDVAREEFPDLDLTVRGAVSIGRRLMDPLAELVKIDPKSIGVGQYQHDVDQTDLKGSLDDVVISCVNKVGADTNRAGVQLLAYISGLGPGLARNIVAYRNENGPFESKKDLKKVSRLGPKAFEQSAGFLRVYHGENPLDTSAVHPESYHVVEKMAKDIGCSVKDLMAKPDLRKEIDFLKYVSDEVGLPTLNDIMDELAKPGRDPREEFEAFAFEEGIEKIADLEVGMKIPGIVTNVTAFGAFVDVGVHQDGLVHISELSDGFVKNPSDIVKVQQKVKVSVLEIDHERKRISLSLKTFPGKKKAPRKDNPGKLFPTKPKKQKNEKKPFNNPFAEFFKS